MLWLLLPVLLLVYLLYRRRAPRARPWAGVWLWKRGRARRFRPRLDLRLLLLLLGAALMVLALEDPPRPKPFGPGGGRLGQHGRKGRKGNPAGPRQGEGPPLLERSPEAVLVRAGERPEAFGPAPGIALKERLLALEAKDRKGDLEAAIALGRRLLKAPVVVATDGPRPPGWRGTWAWEAPGRTWGSWRWRRGSWPWGTAQAAPFRPRWRWGGRPSG